MVNDNGVTEGLTPTTRKRGPKCSAWKAEPGVLLLRPKVETQGPGQLTAHLDASLPYVTLWSQNPGQNQSSKDTPRLFGERKANRMATRTHSLPSAAPLAQRSCETTQVSMAGSGKAIT